MVVRSMSIPAAPLSRCFPASVRGSTDTTFAGFGLVATRVGAHGAWCLGARPDRAQCVENHRDVDSLLNEGAGNGGEAAEPGPRHRGGAEPQTDPDALPGDAHRSPPDLDAPRHVRDRVVENDDVRGLRRDADTMARQRDA